jgi:hypothetical protein
MANIYMNEVVQRDSHGTCVSIDALAEKLGFTTGDFKERIFDCAMDQLFSDAQKLARQRVEKAKGEATALITSLDVIAAAKVIIGT